MTRLKRHTAALAAVGSLALGLSALTAAPTQAAPQAVTCSGWDYSNLDHGSGTLTRGANMKVGPYAACGNVRGMDTGTKVYYWCYTVNDYGNTWTYARIAGTETHGWISDSHLSDGGAGAECPQRVDAPRLPAELNRA
ncbi:SH3 domain-containing protein [Streptomyces spectabilis]|uniref:SH3 domain-containing protein n=1 Tax=Streptomyces spectabilis TaxID=68270 RepID=UPI0033C6CCCC